MSRREMLQNARGAAATGAVGLTSMLLGLIAAPLPPRWRRAPALETSMWRGMSIPSGLLQSVAFLALFVLGYLHWMDATLATIDAKAATHANADEHVVMGRALLLSNPILPFIFMFTSITGLVTAIGALGGLVRVVHGAVTKEVLPDPALGLIDFGVAKLQRKAGHSLRERAKDRRPDRLILGRPQDGFAITIETQQDFDWSDGNTVVVANAWYRLKSRQQFQTPYGLRLRYVLEEMPTGIAIRGLRRYDPGHAPVVTRAGEPEPD
jgi:hypothetical protein